MARPSSYPLRISDELREKLEAEAVDSGRSYNAELAMRLQLSIKIEEASGVILEYVPTLIEDLSTGPERIKSLKAENEKLKEKLRALQSEFSSSFAISGADKSGIALMKLKKAYSHIASGLDEISSLLPDEKK